MLKITFSIVFISFVLGQFARFSFPGAVAVTALDGSVLVLIGVWIVRKLVKGESLPVAGKIEKSFVLFILTCLVSLVVNSYLLAPSAILIASLYLVRFVMYGIVYIIVKEQGSAMKQFLIRSLLITGGFVTGIGFMQYFFYQNLRNLFYLGWDDHLYRLFATFLDPNFVGAFLALLLFLFFGVLFRALQEKRKVLSFVIVVSILFTFIAFFLTFSRSALLMFVLGGSLLFILLGKKKWVFLILSLLAVGFFFSSRYFYLENVNPFRIVSSSARVTSTQETMRIIRDNPIFGVGFNAFRYAQLRYGFRSIEGASISHADAGTDNSFLFVLATTGIIGFSAYLFFWMEVVKRALVCFIIGNRILAAIFLASITGLFIDSLFLNSLFFPPLLIWLGILFGLMDCR